MQYFAAERLQAWIPFTSGQGGQVWLLTGVGGAQARQHRMGQLSLLQLARPHHTPTPTQTQMVQLGSLSTIGLGSRRAFNEIIGAEHLGRARRTDQGHTCPLSLAAGAGEGMSG